jgi:hypothetical protein
MVQLIYLLINFGISFELHKLLNWKSEGEINLNVEKDVMWQETRRLVRKEHKDVQRRIRRENTRLG